MTDTHPIQVLLVEDNPSDVVLAEEALCERQQFHLQHVNRLLAAMELLTDRNVDVVLLDLGLPDAQGLETLQLFRERILEIPVVVMTSQDDEDLGLLSLRQGAQDYLVKGQFQRTSLGRSIRYAIERKRTEESLRQAERLAAIGQMMTSLVHESGNALARCQASLDLLSLEVEDDPNALILVDRVQEAYNQLNRLYEDVRSYAAPIQLDRSRHDLQEIWQKAWSNIMTVSSGRDATLTADTDGIDLRCPVDAFRIEQVFRNLLENALAATPDPARIEIHCTEEVNSLPPLVRIALRDNGPGLSRDAQRRVFEAFFTTKPHGTGLGMAIVRRIVEMHGGTIEASQTYGAGAEFIVSLPRN